MAELLAKIVRLDSIYLRTDGTWADIGAPAFVTSNWSNGGGIGMAPDGHIFVIWSDPGSSEGCRLFEYLGSSTWAQLTLLRAAYHSKFYPVSADEIWFAGNNGSGHHAVHWTRSGGPVGESWPGYTPPSTVGKGACIVMPSGDVLISQVDIQGGGQELVVWRRPAAGPPWVNELKVGAGAGGVGQAIWSPDGTNVWTGSEGTYRKSTDGGLSWGGAQTTPISPGRGFLAAAGDADNDIVLAFSDGLSRWDGATWVQNNIFGHTHRQVIRLGGVFITEDLAAKDSIYYLSGGSWQTEVIPGAASGFGDISGQAIAGVDIPPPPPPNLAFDEPSPQWAQEEQSLATVAALAHDEPGNQYAAEEQTLDPVAPLAYDEEVQFNTGWSLLSFAPYTPPPPSDILISGVTPETFGQQGGFELTLTLGGAVVAGDIQVYVDGVLCYGGQGYAYTPHTDGTTVTVWSPLLTSKGSVMVTAKQGAVVSNEFPVTIMERPWSGKQFGIRQAFPPWYGIGARRLDLEDPL